MHYYIDVLKNYAVFSGRARRKEYWMFFLWNLVIYLVLAFAPLLLTSFILSTANIGLLKFVDLMPFLVILYGLAVLIPSLAVTVRRLHDIGCSGAWIFISLVPLVGWIILFVFTVIDSKPGDNQYGPNPKGVAAQV